MNKRTLTAVLAGLMLLGSHLWLDAGGQSDRMVTRRFAFLVGANDGGKDRGTLRYAVADAREMKTVLEDMGGVLPQDSRFLEEPNRETFLKEIQALARSVADARDKFRRVEVFFYYSGHSDENSLFLGDSRITYAEFKNLITSMDADVRIAILDSCASGNLALPKGVTKKSPFLLDTAYDMKGYAFMTSSSASEVAQESGRLKKSYFTHNLISGMRGAADMNQDGRITLSEAYQFAFDGTLTQTEKTMAGPQHPSYHIQMSGTGDVVITEIGKSSAVLNIKKDVNGKIYIHNQDNVLVVELSKTAGREISIGLDAGDYRIITVAAGAIMESKISLEAEKTVALGRQAFQKTEKIPTELRGTVDRFSLEPEIGRADGKWQVEVFGGFASLNPTDLNMRADFDDMSRMFYYDDYLQYLKSQGQIASFSKANEGGQAQFLRHSIPFGMRLRYRLAGWLDFSLGLTRFSGDRNSSYKNTYHVTENDGLPSVYFEELSAYTLGSKGYIPSFGVHLGTPLTRNLRLEGYLAGGPLFAECLYSLSYESQGPLLDSGGNLESPENGILEERGSGTGLSVEMGARLDLRLKARFGVFLEGGYAYQRVSSISGPGIRSLASHRDSWEGDWGIKQDVKVEPWGTARFLWPSNGWTIFGGTWWRLRDFELDLSGVQMRMGLSYRF
jgi:hypothetical protein